MIVNAFRTRIFNKNDNLFEFIKESIDEVPEKSILLITSKIVALSQGRTISRDAVSKKELVLKEADEVLGESYKTYLTIKEGILIPAAGIDESNAQEEYILWPEDSYKISKELWIALKEHYKIKDFGIVLTDSRCTPLRQGVTGVAVAHWGFKGILNHIGKEDLFGRLIEMSTTNVADCLTSAAILVMGESNESSPLALISEVPQIEFQETVDRNELIISRENDIFAPLFK